MRRSHSRRLCENFGLEVSVTLPPLGVGTRWFIVKKSQQFQFIAVLVLLQHIRFFGFF